MYPVLLGYETAIERIHKLNQNGHYAEALVTSVFTVEKTLRRTLRELVVSAGFTSKHADKIIGNLNGLNAIKGAWELYDPTNTKLTDIVPPGDWDRFVSATRMRNKLVHGERVYKLSACQEESISVLSSLSTLKDILDTRYGDSGWKTLSRRKIHKLYTDPKVRII